MKNKWKVSIAVLGSVMVLASIVVTLVSASKVNIIGGASWPTLQFYFSQNAWMATLGILLILAGIFIRKTK